MDPIPWIKRHKLSSVLLVIVSFFLLKDLVLSLATTTSSFQITRPTYDRTVGLPSSLDAGAVQSKSAPNTSPFSLTQTSMENRMVIKNSALSLLINDVKKTGEQIIAYAKNSGGYMVSASYERPNESPFAAITVRVPADKLEVALAYFRSLAVKVINENLVGEDVTDQYTDIEAQIATLKSTKQKFEEIMNKATKVEDILNVQREIINTQQQIDSYVGQKKALEQNAQLTKITVYLSTDELALPYTPSQTFRPEVIFKQAVRSLLGILAGLGTIIIWLAVFSVIWGPILAIIVFVKKRRGK